MLDMTIERISHESPMPDTGSLDGDLFVWGCRMAHAASGPEGSVLVRTLMQAKPADRVMLWRRGEEIQALLDRAAARGEPRLTYVDVLDDLVAPIFIRQLFGIGGLNEALVRVLVARTIGFGARGCALICITSRAAAR